MSKLVRLLIFFHIKTKAVSHREKQACSHLWLNIFHSKHPLNSWFCANEPTTLCITSLSFSGNSWICTHLTDTEWESFALIGSFVQAKHLDNVRHVSLISCKWIIRLHELVANVLVLIFFLSTQWLSVADTRVFQNSNAIEKKWILYVLVTPYSCHVMNTSHQLPYTCRHLNQKHSNISIHQKKKRKKIKTNWLTVRTEVIDQDDFLNQS